MILCKVLKEAATEVPALLSSKIYTKHAGEDLEAMAAIARAAKDFSLEEFRNAVSSPVVHVFLHPPVQVSTSTLPILLLGLTNGVFTGPAVRVSAKP